MNDITLSTPEILFDRKYRYWLLDAASYYFDHALRFGQPDYKANDEDVIMTRIRTTGIDTTEFSEPPYMYSVVDVGGQRNERRKWMHCFDNVRVSCSRGVARVHRV